MELISIIIPVYNGEKTLAACVESVRGQSYEHWELLIINDGSQDGTSRLCDTFAETDPRIRVFYQANAGVSAARNCGLKEADGEYITFLDADDVIPADYLTVLHCACSGADIAVCDVVSIVDGQEKQRFTLEDTVLTQKCALDYLLMRRGINSGPCAKLFRRGIVQDLKFPSMKTYEDILFVKDAFCRAERIAVTNRTEYRYIQNDVGAMSSFYKAPSTDIVEATKQLLLFIRTRTDLNPGTCYITASHLMQYVPLAQACPEGTAFIRQAQRLYRFFWRDILRCAAFPWKEKVVYLLFSCGWLYQNKKIQRI